jgi:hypothetical protein
MFKPEQVLVLLRQIQLALADDKELPQAYREASISQKSLG